MVESSQPSLTWKDDLQHWEGQLAYGSPVWMREVSSADPRLKRVFYEGRHEASWNRQQYDGIMASPGMKGYLLQGAPNPDPRNWEIDRLAVMLHEANGRLDGFDVQDRQQAEQELKTGRGVGGLMVLFGERLESPTLHGVALTPDTFDANNYALPRIMIEKFRARCYKMIGSSLLFYAPDPSFMLDGKTSFDMKSRYFES